jgi:hypothetical protein
MFSKRHYETLAASFLKSKPDTCGAVPVTEQAAYKARRDQWERDVMTLAGALKIGNALFDIDVFWAACNGLPRPTLKSRKTGAVKCA